MCRYFIRHFSIESKVRCCTSGAHFTFIQRKWLLSTNFRAKLTKCAPYEMSSIHWVIAIFNARFNHLGILTDWNGTRTLLPALNWDAVGNVTHQKPLIYFIGTICPCVSDAFVPDSDHCVCFCSSLFFFVVGSVFPHKFFFIFIRHSLFIFVTIPEVWCSFFSFRFRLGAEIHYNEIFRPKVKCDKLSNANVSYWNSWKITIYCLMNDSFRTVKKVNESELNRMARLKSIRNGDEL